MSVFQSIRNRVINNPILGRQLATHFTGGRLGWVFFLLTGGLTLTHGILFAYFAQELSSSDTGATREIAFFYHFAVIMAFIILFLPIKVCGFIEGPRASRSFDQIVVTGASPLLFFLGACLSGNLYQLVLYLITLPFAVSINLFLEVDFITILSGYFHLFLYGNVIMALTCAMSIPFREWVAVPMTIIGLFLWNILSVIIDRDWVIFWRPHIAEFVPIRLLSRIGDPFESEFGNYYQRLQPYLNDDPVFFSWAIPLSIYPYLAWGTIILVSLLIIVLGPKLDFGPGLNVFGAVTFKGDRRKRSFRKARWGLVRKVEVAFFYENCVGWVKRWADMLRATIEVLPVLFVWGGTTGCIYAGTYVAQSTQFFRDDSLLGSMIVCGLILLVWIFFQCDPASRVYRTERWGPWKPSRETVLWLQFLILLASYFLIHVSIIEVIMNTKGWGGISLNYKRHGLIFLSAMSIFGLNLFALSRIFSRWTQSAAFPRSNIIIMGVLAFMCSGVGLALEGFPRLKDIGVILAGSSPILVVEDLSIDGWSHKERAIIFFAVQGIFFFCQFTLLAFLRVRKARLDKIAEISSVESNSKDEASDEGESPKPQLRNASWLIFISFLTLASFGSSVIAQEVELKVPSQNPTDLIIEKSSRGFNGKIFTEGRDFTTVLLHNPTDKTIRGEYFVRYSKYESEVKTFEIGPNTKRYFRWLIHQERRGNYYRQYDDCQMVFKVPEGELLSPILSVEIRSPVSRYQSSNEIPSRYLFIGKEFKTSTEFREVAVDGNRAFVAHAPVWSLPTDAIFYHGLRAVFVGDLDDTQENWGATQAQALFNYLRMGGTVVFTGNASSSGLAGTLRWKSVLSGLETRSITYENRQFTLGAFPGGRAELQEDLGESEPVSLLNVKNVGGGLVAHLAFPLEENYLPVALENREFWNRFIQALGDGIAFPMVLRSSYGYLGELIDYFLLVVIIGSLAIYTLIIGGVPLIFFRKKKARKALWIGVVTIPLVSVLAIPLLSTILQQRSSVASINSIHFFGESSPIGITQANLTIYSSGRQEHSLEIAGESPISYSNTNYHYGYNDSRILVDNAKELIRPEKSDYFEADLQQPPWSKRSWRFYDSLNLQNLPEVSATLNQQKKTCRLKLTVPDWMTGGQITWLVLGGDSKYIRAESYGELGPEEKEISLRVTFDPDRTQALVDKHGLKSKKNAYQRYRLFNKNVQVFGMNIVFPFEHPIKNRVYLLWDMPDSDVEKLVKFKLQSDSLIFKQPISRRNYERSNRHVRSKIKPENGGYTRILENNIMMIEVPLKTG